MCACDTENGVLSFAELVRKVLPPDYTGRQWTEIRDDELMKESHARELRQMETTVKKWPKSLEATKPTIRKLKEQLATKILERTKRANDQYREGASLHARHGRPIKWLAANPVGALVVGSLATQPSSCLDHPSTVSYSRTSNTSCVRWGSWLPPRR